MSTPAHRSDTSPATPATPASPSVRREPVPVLRPFGWLLMFAASIGLILASWLLYGVLASGMWAGYRDGFIGTVVLVCAMALNTTLPKRPFLGLVALSGILLVLFAAFLDDSTSVFVSEVVAGAGMLVGAACYAAGDR